MPRDCDADHFDDVQPVIKQPQRLFRELRVLVVFLVFFFASALSRKDGEKLVGVILGLRLEKEMHKNKMT